MQKIALVGGHHRTKMQAPFTDKSWTVCSFSARNLAKLPRHEEWIEIHRREAFEDRYPQYAAWLKLQPLVYMQAHYPEYPGSVPYPLSAVIKAFGTQFLKNTACLALAKAILDDPVEIGVYGIEQTAAHAAKGSRLAVIHFIREAERRGIKVTHPPASRLMRDDPIYGFEPEAFAA